MNDPDLDAEFARIVAGWDSEADPHPLRRAPAGDAATSGPPDAGDREAVGPAPAADRGPASPPASDAATPPQTGLFTDAGSPTGSAASIGAARPADHAGPVDPDVRADPEPAPELPTVTSAPGWRAPTSSEWSPESDDEHFEPPTVTDLPSAEDDPMFWAIVGGLAGGPLLLLYVLLFDRGGSGWWVVAGLTMAVVGFVLLVLRGGTQRDPNDDGIRL